MHFLQNLKIILLLYLQYCSKYNLHHNQILSQNPLFDANTGFIEISAKPYILQYFYQAGILAHRSIGFGMIDLIAQKNI